MLKNNLTRNKKYIAVTRDYSDETIRLINNINLSSETELNTRSNKKLDKCGKSYNNNFNFYS